MLYRAQGLMILVTVMAINFLGDGMRDALDPRARGWRMTGPLRISADRLIDGRSDLPVDGASVLVEGTRVVGVGPAADLICPPDTEDLHFPGCTLLPGLIDVHAHLTFGTGPRTYEQVMREDSDDLMLVRAVRNCQLHLAAGVTTVRDCGARNRTSLSLRDAAQLGLFPSSRLLVSGPPLTITGGHFWWCNGEADGTAGVQQQARRLLKQGVDFLKIMASGGGTAGTPSYRPNSNSWPAFITWAHASSPVPTPSPLSATTPSAWSFWLAPACAPCKCSSPPPA
jgi:hypothetical protein